VFVFNGKDRLGGKSPEPGGTEYEPGHEYPVATQSERDHIPILPPSPTRLLARVGPLSGERLGLELLGALILGIPALLCGVMLRRRRLAAAPEDGDEDDDPGGGDPGGGDPADDEPTDDGPEDGDAAAEPRERRLGLAFAAGLGLWLLTGIVLFSHMVRLHPRYVEGFVPAVAAVLGIGAAWAAEPRGRLRPATLLIALAAVVYYGERLLYGTPGVWWISLLAALAALGAAALARVPALGAALRLLLAPGAVLVLSLVAMLAISVQTDVRAIKDHVTDAGEVGVLPGDVLNPLSSYLRAHQGTARYEVAAQSSTQIGALIVKDARPVVVLTSYAAKVFTTVEQLKRKIAAGEVRYAFLNSPCPHHTSAASAKNPACSPPAMWIREHGSDVSREAGLPHAKVLWRLPGVAP
jgi:hypothetical protein